MCMLINYTKKFQALRIQILSCNKYEITLEGVKLCHAKPEESGQSP